MQNKLFHGLGPTWANACVGENGLPGNKEYAKGYSLAANILLDRVLGEGKLTDLVDQVVYPICFNMRHSIELRLKETVLYLFGLSEYKDIVLSFDLDSSHDIGKIWDYIKEYAPQLDERYTHYITKVDEEILDIANVDPTGQTFRYPTSNESQKHLVDVSLINLAVLKRSFVALEANLDKLERFNMLILDEYDLKTHTKNLSRSRLFDLANDLPARDLWENLPFKDIKADLRKKYAISSNEFSRAINKIEPHYELGSLINLDKGILGLSDDDLRFVILLWDKLHDVSSLNKWLTDDLWVQVNDQPKFEDYKKDAELRDQIFKDCQDFLTPEKVAGIHALFYLARDSDYSEGYVSEYELQKRILDAGNEDLYQSAMHILDKTNGFQMIITSLYWIGKACLADELVSKYSLSEEHEWLISCRDRSRFAPDHLLCYQGLEKDKEENASQLPN
ncbi:hypothetical protein ACMXYO_01095 [Neptuniibacter sp. QD37_6]|uniref:hypothetical protein n=1 Tax=Neptuniibacter sp. QD37_6 TaxID=3398210 RepID=UPI0039F5F541